MHFEPANHFDMRQSVPLGNPDSAESFTRRDCESQQFECSRRGQWLKIRKISTLMGLA